MSNLYKVGGALPLDAPSYIRRQADQDLYEGLLSGEFCYVLNSRQMGKSSLRVQTMRRLQAAEVVCAAIDITKIGSQGITPEEWYAGVLFTLINQLHLSLTLQQFEDWWEIHRLLSPVNRFSEFIDGVLLEKLAGRIVIFIDEIDSVLQLDFKDDFFAAIRACYNKRAENPEYDRLTFSLLGVATPSNLIQDKNRTPFNIGRAIQLNGFQFEEARSLAQGLADKAANPEAVLQAILNWSGGQPFLTQKLCQLVLASNDSIPEGKETSWIEQLVRVRVIENWESQDEPEHLRTIRDRILNNKQQTSRLIGLYQQILNQSEVPADITFEQIELRLSGLVVEQQSKIQIYNKVYKAVFNQSWIDNILTALRPYAESIVAWLNSSFQDESRLLRGQALQDALTWAADKKLSDQDYQFLSESQKLERKEVERALGTQRQANQILAEAQKKAESALEEERKANQRLTQAQQETEHIIRRGRAIRVVTSIIAGITTILAVFAFITTQNQISVAKKARESTNQAEKEAYSAKQDMGRAEQAWHLAKAQLKNVERRRKSAEQKAQQARQELSSAKAKLDQVTKESQNKIAQAQQQVKLAENKVKSTEEKVTTAESQYKNAEQKAGQARQELSSAKAHLAQVTKESQDKIVQAQQQVRNVEQKIVMANQSISKALQDQRNAEKKAQQFQAKVEEATSAVVQAQSIFEKIVPQLANPKNSFASSDLILSINEAYQRFQEATRGIIGDRATDGQTSIGLGQALISQGKYQEALYSFQKALEIFQTSSNLSGKNSALTNLGYAYLNLGQYSQALEAYQQALAISTQIGDRSAQGNILNGIGTIYSSLADYSKALEAYQQALAISTQIGDRSRQGRTLNNIGTAYASLGQYEKALLFYQEALAISARTDDRSSQGRTLNNIGKTYASLGQYPRALEFYQQALAIARVLGDREDEGKVLNNLGQIYSKSGDYSKAIELYSQALPILRQLGNRGGEGSALGNLGNAYASLGDYQKAINYHQQSLAIAKAIRNRLSEGSALGNLGNAYASLKNYSRALEFYQEALAISTQIADPYTQGRMLNNIGKIYADMGQYSKATEFREQCLTIALKINVRSEEICPVLKTSGSL